MIKNSGKKNWRNKEKEKMRVVLLMGTKVKLEQRTMLLPGGQLNIQF